MNQLQQFPPAFLSLALLLLTMATTLAEPVIEKVRAAQRSGTNLVDIYYDLSGAEPEGLTVSVELSDDGGASYRLPVSSLWGDLEGVTNGYNRHIVWDAGVDAPDFVSPSMRVRVTARQIEPGLVAYYPLDGNADDLVASNDGVVVGAKPVGGLIGGAYIFDGNDRIEVPHSSDIDFDRESFSLSAWIRISESYRQGDIHIIDKRSGVSGSWAGVGYNLFIRNGKASIALQNTIAHTSGDSVADGEWHNVVATINREELRVRIFIDGQLSNTGNIRDNSVANDGKMKIGSRASNNGGFNGIIDDVKIYNRALTSDEILTLYSRL